MQDSVLLQHLLLLMFSHLFIHLLLNIPAGDCSGPPREDAPMSVDMRAFCMRSTIDTKLRPSFGPNAFVGDAFNLHLLLILLD